MEKSSMSLPRPFTWPTASSDYKLLKRIGNGAFSCVWKAICASNSVDVAIKIMDLELITTSFEDILQEVQTMRLCDNANVLRCFCSFVRKDQLWLVTELMDKGSCLRVMNVARHYGFGEGMNEEWLAYILREALQGLRYLHDNGQIHRDIKSGNILLNSRGEVRIADFGVSGWTLARGQRQETVKTFVGTPCWMAPEVMEQIEGYDYRADIWSIGITALELAKGMAPYAKYPPMRVLVLTIEEDPPSLKSSSYDNDRQRTGAPFSRMYDDFVRKCLQKSPKLRPSAEELLKHKFFKGRTKDALLHQLLDHLPPVGSGEDEDINEENLSTDSAEGSFFRDAGSVGSKSSSNNPDFDLQSVESTTHHTSSPPRHPGTTLCSSPLRTNRVSFGRSIDESKNSENNSVSEMSGSEDKDFVSGTTWVFDNSLGESGVISMGNDSAEGAKLVAQRRRSINRRRSSDEADDDLGEFMDGFDRETATMKSSDVAKKSNHSVAVVEEPNRKEPVRSEFLAESNYMMPTECSSVVLDCGSIASSLNSMCNDDVVSGLLDGGAMLFGQTGANKGPHPLLGAAKENIFEFDDRDRIISDELIAQAGGLRPGPLLRGMDDKMVSSLNGNEALERLIGSGLYPKASASASSIDRQKSKEDDDDEDIDVFLDGFEEETADMNF